VFARSEFEVVQFLPAPILPQLLLCGLLVARDRMPRALHALSDLLPMCYAVDGMHRLTLQAVTSGPLWGDIAIVLMFAVGALVLGAGTPRRRTA
jgi:ABC-2 type transport system permease protein